MGFVSPGRREQGRVRGRGGESLRERERKEGNFLRQAAAAAGVIAFKPMWMMGKCME